MRLYCSSFVRLSNHLDKLFLITCSGTHADKLSSWVMITR